MIQKSSHTLINPHTGNLAFKLYSVENDNPFDHIQRLNYYSLILISKGEGSLKADFSEYKFSDNTLLAFSPFQPFMLKAKNIIQAIVIHFHPDFFCIHKHQKEVACNGVLFNNIYHPPLVTVDEAAKVSFEIQVKQIIDELKNPKLAQYEILVSHLKILLITA
ncbi:MAG: hypothetical protein WEA58_02610 [Balneolaceae bacterium]